MFRQRTKEEHGAQLALQLLFLVFMGGMAALARRYLDLHIGVPGHTGLPWMFIMVLGRGLVRRDGAGVVMGVSIALWGLTLGFKQGLPYNLMMYSLTGLVLDLVARLPGVNIGGPGGGLAGGALAHVAKFLFVFGYAAISGNTKNFALVGNATAFAYHLTFGAAGGLLAGLVLWRQGKR